MAERTCWRRRLELVSKLQGPERTYWVAFDEPQRDTDGGGPYISAQVLERYLEPADL